jgi:uncharacterized membrane protein
MKNIWKYLILGFIVAVLVLFTVIAFVYGTPLAGYIMCGVDLLVVVFFVVKYVQSKTKKK